MIEHEQATQIQQFGGLLEPQESEQQEEQEQGQEEVGCFLFSFRFLFYLTNAKRGLIPRPSGRLSN